MNSGPNPTVSVIIPTYNRAEILTRSVKSVLNQTFEDIEVIVVDDASEDHTGCVIGDLNDDRIKYVRHQENQHVSAARNTGIELAKGEYIAFLDDDDCWLPGKLEQQVSAIKNQPDIGMVYCWMSYQRDGEELREYAPALRGDIFAETLVGQPIGNVSTLLVRSSVIEEVGGFDEGLARGNDGDFIRRVAKSYNIDYVPEVLVIYSVGHGADRITTNDYDGIRNAIRGERTKLNKFETDLSHHPRAKAIIYARIAYRHAQIGDWSLSILNAVKSIMISIKAPSAFVSMFRLFLASWGSDDELG
jgi:glycosyltransferase involved in cell wall biosynthesis